MQRLTFLQFSSLIISIVQPAFIRITLALYSISHFSMTKSQININQLIFIISDTIFRSICHLMMVLTIPRSFILYFFEKDFFNVLKIFILSDVNKISSMYTLIILVLFSNHLIRILRSVFNYTNWILLQNTIMFQFYSLPNCFRLYKLLNSLHKSFLHILQR